MCEGESFSNEFDHWMEFQGAADAGPGGFEIVNNGVGGVYCLRVRVVGETDMREVKNEYLASALVQGFFRLDQGSEQFFQGIGLGEGWGWNWTGMIQNRLQRLNRIEFDGDGTQMCPILYVGQSKRLRRRFHELTRDAHTVNHPYWALMHSGWRFDLGWKTTGTPSSDEERLKSLYRTGHRGRLPALQAR